MDMPSDPRLVIANVLAGMASALVTVYVIAGLQTMLPANVVGISTRDVRGGICPVAEKTVILCVGNAVRKCHNSHSVCCDSIGRFGLNASSGIIIAFIFGLGTIGLGVAKGIETTRIAATAVSK